MQAGVPETAERRVCGEQPVHLHTLPDPRHERRLTSGTLGSTACIIRITFPVYITQSNVLTHR